MDTQRPSPGPSSTTSESFTSLPLSPSPTTSYPPPYTPTTDGFSLTQAGSFQASTQPSYYSPHVFSRHDSFSHTQPPPAFSSFQGPSFTAGGAGQPFLRLPSFQNPKSRRALDRIVSMDRRRAPDVFSAGEDVWKGEFVQADSAKLLEDRTAESSLMHRERKWHSGSIWGRTLSLLQTSKQGSGAKKLTILILLNFAYSTVELVFGLFLGRVGLVSDAFHLTFGCGLLTFSLIAMLYTKKPPDDTYTYGYKRMEVLAALTNALFLLFLSFSLAVEALHAFVQDESEHKHYLIVSAVTNLCVNLLGVWFFRSYARIRIAYRKAEDMNYHSIFLHVLADSIRSAGLILASWLLTLGVKNAETLCLGLVAIAVFLVVMPLFKATAGVLSQMTPASMSVSILHKCLRQVKALEDVLDSQARFWEMVPGFVVGTLSLQVKAGTNEQKLLKHVHSVYNDIGIKDLTVQIDIAP
ncbi:hypothetical protein GOP47_0018557 [Adiantum capillus-veneris]|uniref:Cation efflux protein transmembrane domain-containing protein n=1 Tax=Adiantum capillus-veneris TaxID=13818 RepID=A0A9D4Z896_ADICA|nr:hypothetical protein GOP47_0018557 [Adiantum capillus-veneris]